MESKLNHNIITGCCVGTILLEYAFLGIHTHLSNNGGNVEALKLYSQEIKVSDEKSFREMILAILSVPFDRSRLTNSEIGSINEMTMYLTTPIEEE